MLGRDKPQRELVALVSNVQMDADVNAIVTPSRLWSRNEVLSRPCPVPASPGVYGWYFRQLPWSLDASDCVQHDNMPLLYVGIAPKMPPANGARASHQTLRDRIRYHYSGNAEGSTLRLTLGCLLADHLGIELRRVGGGTRLTFSAGEAVLSEWMVRTSLSVGRSISRRGSSSSISYGLCRFRSILTRTGIMGSTRR
jgi:hypothetical protein